MPRGNDWSGCDYATAHDKARGYWHIVYREEGGDWQQVTSLSGKPITFYEKWRADLYVSECKAQARRAS